MKRTVGSSSLRLLYPSFVVFTHLKGGRRGRGGAPGRATGFQRPSYYKNGARRAGGGHRQRAAPAPQSWLPGRKPAGRHPKPGQMRPQRHAQGRRVATSGKLGGRACMFKPNMRKQRGSGALREPGKGGQLGARRPASPRRRPAGRQAAGRAGACFASVRMSTVQV